MGWSAISSVIRWADCFEGTFMIFSRLASQERVHAVVLSLARTSRTGLDSGVYIETRLRKKRGGGTLLKGRVDYEL